MKDYREMVSGITHLIAAVLAAVGTVWLIRLTWHDPPKLITMLIFSASMVLLFLASTTMHLHAHIGSGQKRLKKFLQRLDHAAIYVMIAGGYTPFCYFLLNGWMRGVMLLLIWSMAAIGVILKLIFFWEGHASTLFYVIMGWTAVFAAPEFLAKFALGGIALVVAGGLTYTIGAVIFALHRPNFHRHFGHHELWHLCVMFGSLLHFMAIRIYLI